jgi:hypothetical protein
MQIEITGGMPTHPKNQVEAVEYVARSLCIATGKDPAEGVMMLLTAACVMARKHSNVSDDEFIEGMAKSLGSAAAAAAGFMGKPAKIPAPANVN